jgi:hypothetical protein
MRSRKPGSDRQVGVELTEKLPPLLERQSRPSNAGKAILRMN